MDRQEYKRDWMRRRRLDPAYRERDLERNRQYRARNRAVLNQKAAEKYHSKRRTSSLSIIQQLADELYLTRTVR